MQTPSQTKNRYCQGGRWSSDTPGNALQPAGLGATLTAPLSGDHQAAPLFQKKAPCRHKVKGREGRELSHCALYCASPAFSRLALICTCAEPLRHINTLHHHSCCTRVPPVLISLVGILNMMQSRCHCYRCHCRCKFFALWGCRTEGCRTEGCRTEGCRTEGSFTENFSL